VDNPGFRESSIRATLAPQARSPQERDAGWQAYLATVAPDFVSLIQIAYFRARCANILASEKLAERCKDQDFRTKTRPLIASGFSGAEIRCRIIPMNYGYARVSTDGQSIDARVRQARRAMASGAETNRAQGAAQITTIGVATEGSRLVRSL
jgi:hypothetical protein